METRTRSILSAAMEADRTITPRMRATVLAFLNGDSPTPGDSMPEIITRKEAALLLKRSVKRCDQLASNGYLARVPVPGSRRALGYTAESVRAILKGCATKEGEGND